MPNPLTDELTDEAKAVLVVKFAELKAQLAARIALPIGRR